jgi:hypothetical protein
MTPEKQRIAIAEACGWTDCYYDASRCAVAPTGWFTRYAGTPYEVTIRVGLPDYLSDLNAMHEAEKMLTDDQQVRFLRHLVGSDAFFDEMAKLDPHRYIDREEFCNNHLHKLGWDEVSAYCLLATAAQRAEAFLRTLGKWEESK